MKFDLHLHSYFSDGRYSPKMVVEECKKLGLEVISLTDHENVGGVPEAVKAGEGLGIKIIPGIELAAGYQGKEYHILGYFIDYQNPKLKEFLDKWRETKIVQIKKIVRKLQEFGFKISFEEVMAQVKGAIDRPHVSQVIFQNSEENLPVLKRYLKPQEAAERNIFFRKFLLEKPPGEGLAYAKRKLPEIREVIFLIQELGGLAFLAHPLWKNKNISKAREKTLIFQKFGLDGLEMGYPFHTKEQTLVLHQIAQDFSMYESAGSDFHGEGNIVRQIGNFQTFGIKINFPFTIYKFH